MPPRLSPEEREARRKARVARSFSDAAYRHYNPQIEGYGSPDEWIKAAEATLAGHGGFLRQPGNHTKVTADMALLGLGEMPAELATLKRAFHKMAFIAHPDHGGSALAMRELLAAFLRLANAYK